MITMVGDEWPRGANQGHRVTGDRKIERNVGQSALG